MDIVIVNNINLRSRSQIRKTIFSDSNPPSGCALASWNMARLFHFSFRVALLSTPSFCISRRNPNMLSNSFKRLNLSPISTFNRSSTMFFTSAIHSKKRNLPSIFGSFLASGSLPEAIIRAELFHPLVNIVLLF